jgi:integrase
MGIKAARVAAMDVKTQLAEGIDPSAQRKQKKQAQRLEATGGSTFKDIAELWRVNKRGDLSAGSQARDEYLLNKYLYPAFGDMPITDIKSPTLLAVLEDVATTSLEHAHRCKFITSLIYRYAAQRGHDVNDITAVLKGALPTRKVKHHAAPVDDLQLAGEILRSIDAAESLTMPVKAALQLLPMLAVRPGELRQMKWQDVDLDGGVWKYTASKTARQMIVYLPEQAVSILRDLYNLSGAYEYVFISPRSNTRPISDMALNAGLQRLGWNTKEQITAHGWRAFFRSVGEEHLDASPRILELMLGHAVKGPLGETYSRAAFLDKRKAHANQWAAFLDKIKDSTFLDRQK